MAIDIMNNELEQFQRAWLKSATPAQILIAQADGLLDEILKPSAPPVEPANPSGGAAQLHRAQLAGMDSAAIMEAVKAGTLSDVLAGREPQAPEE
ncbi:hypothetical protein ACEZCY_30915 [Streptacidiphilus sp. N1-12]|uniref:Uncharacterized protein n=2 Tax=Streptacidiphilus alkalitolerans TaxID=3342712 RepID=A0ABV6VI34_9ACTN